MPVTDATVTREKSVFGRKGFVHDTDPMLCFLCAFELNLW